MRIAILAAAAMIGVVTTAGSANATALMDKPAANQAYQVAGGPACPTGSHWDSAHYNHLGTYLIGRCIRG